MYVVLHENNLEGLEVKAEGAMKVVKKSLIGPTEGWQGWVMRLFALGENGHSPKHSHPWPHINYVVSGQGAIIIDGNENELTPGAYAFVPDNIEHQYVNRGSTEFKFICIVAEKGDV